MRYFVDKEAYFIAQFSNSNIGDDGAIIRDQVYSKDLFCEGIHFKREWMSLEQIAKKSMLVNISDAIAMNAKPYLALLGMVIPKSFTYEDLKELAHGFNIVAKEYGIEIIGGDTTAGDKLMISLTIISHTHKPLLRKNAKVGDLVAFTGFLGNAYKDLTKLLRGGHVSSSSRFVSPKLREKFIVKSSKYLHAGMDISDGLSKDLSRLLKQSGNKGIKWSKKVPKRHVCSGEEYEMLFTFSPKNRAKIKRLAHQTRTKITLIGTVVRGRYRCSCKEHHFA